MSKTVHEEARDIPVLDEVDVLVAGGGVAGCAAAVSAARAGARTVLLERNGCLGGVATATLMANIGNHYVNLTSEQVLRGFAAEVVERLVTVGGASPAASTVALARIACRPDLLSTKAPRTAPPSIMGRAARAWVSTWTPASSDSSTRTTLNRSESITTPGTSR